MVKGVSKTVIVVNNTGNKFFEKIVFYVTPEYGNLNSGKLNSAAAKYIGTFDFKKPNNKSLRKIYRRRLLLRFGLITLSAIFSLSVFIYLMCK